MDRRLFLKRAAILASGIVAADQLELLEKLTWKRKYWQGVDFGHKEYLVGIEITQTQVDSDFYTQLDDRFRVDKNHWFVTFDDISNARLRFR